MEHELLQALHNFFNQPFFVILSGLSTLFSVFVIILVIYTFIKGIFPVWYRLGIGLTKRKIAVFAVNEFDSLKAMLVDSNIFKSNNIVKIDKNSIKKAEVFTLLLVHWKDFSSEIDAILSIKKDYAALIIYAPQSEGFIHKDTLEKINLERNSIIVNFRGRLLNDILTCMMTTSNQHK